MSNTNTLATQEASLSEKRLYRIFTCCVVESRRSRAGNEHHVGVVRQTAAMGAENLAHVAL